MKLGPWTLDLGSGLLGVFGEDAVYPSMGYPLNTGSSFWSKATGDGWREIMAQHMAFAEKFMQQQELRVERKFGDL